MVLKHSFIIIFCATFIASLSAGEADPIAADDYTPELKPLKVNGEDVTPAEVKKLYENLLRAFKAPGKKLTKALFDKIASKARENATQRAVVRQYIAQHALAITPEQLKEDFEQKKLDLAAEGKQIGPVLTFLQMTETEFMDELRPVFTLSRGVGEKLDPDDVKTAFEKTRANLPLRRASQIVITSDKVKYGPHPERTFADAQKLAASVLDRARNGEDFANLAKELSDDKRSKDKNGDMDFLKPSDTPKPVADALYKLQKVGDLSDVIETEQGLHIVKFTELRSEEEAFKKFRHFYVNQKTSELINKLVKEAKVE